MTEDIVDVLAAKFQVPKFYVQLKLMRQGEDQPGIEASITEDLAVVNKIASDTGQAEPKVRRDFFGQLQAYRSDFEEWSGPITPEEMILRGLRPLQEKRYVGAKPKLAVLLEMGKPQKSSRNSTYRRVTFLVESDIPGSAWDLIRTNLWGSVLEVKVGEACHVILEKNQGWINIKECEPADHSELPDVIPGDPRHKVMILGVSPIKSRKGARDDGSEYEFETTFVTLLVQNPEDPDTTIVLEGSSTFAQRWHEAPNDKVLNTIITQAETESGVFCNVGDWQESKDQTPLSWPEVETLTDFSKEIIEDHVGGYVILDGTPTSIVEKEGARGPFYVMEIHNFLTGSDTSMMLRESAFVEGGVYEVVEGRPYFLANRVKALVRISKYIDQNEKERTSKMALALWNMDSVLPDLPEDLGEDEIPEVPVEETPETPMKEAPSEEIRPAQKEAVDAGIIDQEEAKAVSQILNKSQANTPGVGHSHDVAGETEAPLSAQGQTDVPQTHPVQEAPAPTSKRTSAKKTTGGLRQKQLPAEKGEKKAEASATKGAITSSEQQRIDALRSRLQQKGAQKTTETPL